MHLELLYVNVYIFVVKNCKYAMKKKFVRTKTL